MLESCLLPKEGKRGRPLKAMASKLCPWHAAPLEHAVRAHTHRDITQNITTEPQRRHPTHVVWALCISLLKSLLAA